MTVKIDRQLCNGCGNSQESRCMRICPGDLFKKDSDNKAVIREKKDCWDCAACVKECPNQAIAMHLPVQVGGRGATLQARKEQKKIIWTLKKPDGENEIFIIEAEKTI